MSNTGLMHDHDLNYFNQLRIRKLNIVYSVRRFHMFTLHTIAKNLPITVKEISISQIYCIDSDFDYIKFLDKCHDYLEILNSSSLCLCGEIL